MKNFLHNLRCIVFGKTGKAAVVRCAIFAVGFYFIWNFMYAFMMIDGPSMSPTMADGDVILVNKYIYHHYEPNRWENICIYDKDNDDILCKRILALPGDSVEIKDGYIYINNDKVNDLIGRGRIHNEYVDDKGNPLYMWGTDTPAVEYISSGKLTIPKKHVWIIGDNRGVSWYGILPIKDIVGKVILP